MPRWGVIAGVLACVTAGDAAAQQMSVSQLAKAKGWHSTYETARAEAARTGKPLLVVFRCEP
jgi:hypothetical protein